jgi:hypothetical protein
MHKRLPEGVSQALLAGASACDIDQFRLNQLSDVVRDGQRI